MCFFDIIVNAPRTSGEATRIGGVETRNSHLSLRKADKKFFGLPLFPNTLSHRLVAQFGPSKCPNLHICMSNSLKEIEESKAP